MSEVSIPKQVIAKFLRDRDGTPIGLAAGVKHESGTVRVVWSYTAKADRIPGRISKTRAWQIALGRLATGTASKIPHALDPVIDEVVERSARYFKVPVESVTVAQAI